MKDAKKDKPRKGTTSRLLSYIFAYKWQMIVVVLCIIISAAANAAMGFFLQTLIDSYIMPQVGKSHPDFLPLAQGLGVLAIVFTAGVIATLTYNRILVKVEQGVLKTIRDDMFAHQQTLPIKYFDTHLHGDVMSFYTNDTDALRQAISQANYFGNITMPVVGNMGYLLYVLVAIVGAGAVLGGFRNVSLTGSAALTLGGIVSFLTLSRSFINPIGQISNQFAFVMMALAGASRIFDFLDQAPETNSGTVTLIKAHVAEDGTITQAAHHTDKWAWRVPANVQIEKGVGAVTKTGATTRLAGWRAASVAALAGKTSRTAAGAYTLLRGDIRFKDVNFSYERGHQILHDISLYAKPGQKVALVGATGAGKTTITNLINRFYDIDSGSILYDGINIRDINKKDLRQSLGIVLQDVNLFTGTVMDNIRYGKLDATDDECISAAKLANADGFIRMLPHGYDTVLQGDGSGLSQGQRQLISIARAAVADPPVMILDEATSSIDTRTEQIVQAGMDALMEGRTVFVIAHRLSTIRNSDVIMVMDHGRIIERGTHDQLLEQKGEYYQLYTGAFELE